VSMYARNPFLNPLKTCQQLHHKHELFAGVIRGAKGTRKVPQNDDVNLRTAIFHVESIVVISRILDLPKKDCLSSSLSRETNIRYTKSLGSGTI